MKKLLLLLMVCWPLLTQAVVRTATWCPVTLTGYNIVTLWYQTCFQPTQPTTLDCPGPLDGSTTTSYSWTMGDTDSGWFRVRAAILYLNAQGAYQYKEGPFSNPVEIIGGLTPPAIGGCP